LRDPETLPGRKKVNRGTDPSIISFQVNARSILIECQRRASRRDKPNQVMQNQSDDVLERELSDAQV